MKTKSCQWRWRGGGGPRRVAEALEATGSEVFGAPPWLSAGLVDFLWSLQPEDRLRNLSWASVLARQLLSIAPPSMEPLTHGKPSHPEPPLGTHRGQAPASCGLGANPHGQSGKAARWGGGLSPRVALTAVLMADVWV